MKGLRREISKILRVNLETSLPLIKHILKNGLWKWHICTWCILVIHISHSPPYTFSKPPNTPPFRCHILLIYVFSYLFILTHWIQIFCSYECELSTEVTFRFLTESVVFFSLRQDDPTSKDACGRAVNLCCRGLTRCRVRTDSYMFSSHFHTSTMACACPQTLQFTRTK